MFPGSGGANEVKILLTAVDKASPAFNKVQSELKQTEKQTAGMGGAFKAAHTNMLGMVAAGTAVLGTAVGIGMAIKRTADEYMDYAMEVGNLQRILGASAEETSRLIQLADDYAISTGQLEAALKAAIRKGYEPTVENLGKISDEYLNLQPGIERTKFLMDTFGRSGADLARIMELGSQKIEELGHSIDNTSRLMTEEGKAKAEEYRIMVDNLGDSWTNIANTIGQKVIPILIELGEVLQTDIDMATGAQEGFFNVYQELTRLTSAGKISTETWKKLTIGYFQGKISIDQIQRAIREARNELEMEQPVLIDSINNMERLAESKQKAADSTERLVAGAKNLNDTLGQSHGKATDAADGIDELAESTSSWASRIDLGINSAIANSIEQMDFLQSGGMSVIDTYNEIWAAVTNPDPTKRITPEKADELFRALLPAAEAVLLDIEGKVTNMDYQAALTNIRETLGLGFGEAKKTLDEIWSRKGQTMDMKVFIQFIADINKEIRAGGGGGGGGPNPPRNPPRPIPPEDLEEEEGGRGGGMNIREINVFGGGDPGAIANQVINHLNLLQRGAYRAGIEYTGR